MSKILAWILTACVAATSIISVAQPVYGSAHNGGKYDAGRFISVSETGLIAFPYHAELANPYANIRVVGDKIYGLSNYDEFGGPRSSDLLNLFCTDRPDGKLKMIKKLELKIYHSNGVLNYRQGFSVNGKLLATLSPHTEGLLLSILNTETEETEHSVVIPGFMTRCTPVISGNKVYFSATDSPKNTFFEYDMQTRQLRTIAEVPTTVIAEQTGEGIIGGDNYIFCTRSGANEAFWKINITNGSYEKIQGMNSQTGTSPKGEFVKYNGRYYSLSTYDPALFAIDPAEGRFELILKFPDTLRNPLSTLVELRGRLYGVFTESSNTKMYYLFEYNLATREFKVVQQLPRTNQYDNLAVSTLFVYHDSLFMYGATKQPSRRGILYSVNTNDYSITSSQPFFLKRVDMGKNRPVYADGRFYGIRDSSVYTYDPATNQMTEFYDLSQNNHLYCQDYSGLTASGGLLYGQLKRISPVTEYVLFSLDISTKEFKELHKIPYNSYDQGDEMTVAFNRLYFLDRFANALCFLDLATGDTSRITFDLKDCEYIDTRMVVTEDKLFLKVGNSCTPGPRHSQLEILPSGTYRRISDVSHIANDAKFYSSLEKSGDNIYSILSSSSGMAITAYNTITEETRSVYELPDSVRQVSLLTSGDGKLFFTFNGSNNTYFARYDINSSSIQVFGVTLPLGLIVYPALAQARPTGIDTSEKNINIMALIQNPVSDELIFEMSDQPFEVKVEDIAGRTIKNWQWIHSVLDVSDLPVGLYLYSIRQGNTRAAGKFIKQ